MGAPGNRAIFASKRMLFERNNETLKDMVQGHMAMDIEVAIKTSVGTPVKTGAMKADVRHFKNASGHWRVEADKAYSAYQERGARADGSHRIKRHTTAGTSAGWFKRAIDKVVKNRDQYITEARRALDL